MTKVWSSTFRKYKPVFRSSWVSIRSTLVVGEMTRGPTGIFPKAGWVKRKYTPRALFSAISASISVVLPGGAAEAGDEDCGRTGRDKHNKKASNMQYRLDLLKYAAFRFKKLLLRGTSTSYFCV